ncbi:unnamed protein product [Brachionus calyciflorus]|uniref:Alpha/beta hydrolase fold-5 domain-containing protein n=1 Tax=Brachionus calyciflorus TaxID=104777 RepID=A0A814PFZ9_9BILA|nr:unnamed protein product [Brachionus calyciflorus]
MKYLYFISILLSIVFSTKCNIILKPEKISTTKAGFIFVQGAEIPAINYKKFALELQRKFNGSLWVVLTEFPLNTPEPVLVNNVMSSAYDLLKKNGFDFDKKTPFFFGGHSLGGIIVQDYLIKNFKSLPFNLIGLVLEGSFITRSNRSKKPSDFPAVLTLGGELDGLARLTRISEAFYHDSPQSLDTSMTLVVNGMNHYQFSGEGDRTSTIIKNDIEPEITNEQARDEITSIINSFINLKLNRKNEDDIKLLFKYANSTVDLVWPLIEGLNMEGFYHFNPPCSQGNVPNCTFGSPWSKQAQIYMGSIDTNKLNVFNEMRSVLGIPEHFPSISNCTKSTECLLNISTITQNVYSTLDSLDNGLFPVAAGEARAKMASRQAVLEALFNKKYNFNETDSSSICGEINQMALNWALKRAPLNTIKRYLEKGKVLKIGQDVGPEATGFQWVFTSLKFTELRDDKNKTFVEVRSPTLKTPTDYSIKAIAGVHYCKLLTPARAIEWIYIDSVKP